ncbi:hypothetical protein D9757_011172 [Collybiopsis confluens]|uniref:Uncharacterized protein n=1 Tax=Collybiopsis confluens TaxID=2823264 RepID=A0A8H5H347_9AGAR|nr:hypothetical protein D9757_011172 [Collybiopsis confluens]
MSRHASAPSSPIAAMPESGSDAAAVSSSLVLPTITTTALPHSNLLLTPIRNPLYKL